MFTIEMLPAEYGDCLWIEYGETDDLHRVLIDTGTPTVFKALEGRIRQAKKAVDRKLLFDLFVITHVDDDHIGSAIKLLEQRDELGIEFRDVWFNGYVHLLQAQAEIDRHPGEDLLGAPEEDLLGPVQGERLTELLATGGLPWNRAFRGNAVMLPAVGKELPHRDIAGLTLTVLSPSPQQLVDLTPKWDELVTAEGLVPGKFAPAIEKEEEDGEEDLLGEEINIDGLLKKTFKEDDALPNGTSIVMLAEYEGKRIMLGADAFPTRILRSLSLLQGDRPGRFKLDAFKMSHHGSRRNTSLDLLRQVECESFLFSSNGKKFKHPNPEPVARIIASREGKLARLHFNYRSVFNQVWDNTDLMDKHNYAVKFGGPDIASRRVDLS